MRKSPPIYEPMSAQRRADMDRQRRAHDRVEELTAGFTLKQRGRDGVVYFSEEDRILELPYEIDGTTAGILLYVDGLDTWVLPDQCPTSGSERIRIRAALEDWARLQPGTVTLVSREDLVRPWETEDS